MDCWATLNIEKTSNKQAIKKAYAKLVKQHKPELDPDGYQCIRAAFDAAIAHSNNQLFTPDLQSKLNAESSSESSSESNNECGPLPATVNTSSNTAPLSTTERAQLDVDNWVRELINNPNPTSQLAQFYEILGSTKLSNVFVRAEFERQIFVLGCDWAPNTPWPLALFNAANRSFGWFIENEHLRQERSKTPQTQEDPVEYFYLRLYREHSLITAQAQANKLTWNQLLFKKNRIRLLLHGNTKSWKLSVAAFFNMGVQPSFQLWTVLKNSNSKTSVDLIQKTNMVWWSKYHERAWRLQGKDWWVAVALGLPTGWYCSIYIGSLAHQKLGIHPHLSLMLLPLFPLGILYNSTKSQKKGKRQGVNFLKTGLQCFLVVTLISIMHLFTRAL